MKKIAILVSTLFIVTTSIFSQNKEKIKNYLSYENNIVIKKDNHFRLVALQSVQVQNDTIVKIKGRTIGSFELENLMPINFKKFENLVNERVEITSIFVQWNGGTDSKGNRIWLALSLSSIVLGKGENDFFDYPINY